MKSGLTQKVLVVVGLLAFAATSSAASKKNYCKDNELAAKFKNGQSLKTCQSIPKNRRNELGKKVYGGNPVAVATDKKNNLYVMYTSGTGLRKCQVSGNVVGFKLSENPGDVAYAYFTKKKGKNTRLWDVRAKGDLTVKQCPTVSKVDMIKQYNDSVSNSSKRIGPSVEKYKLISNSRSGAVGVALVKGGRVLVWTDKDFYLNGKGGKKGYAQFK